MFGALAKRGHVAYRALLGSNEVPGGVSDWASGKVSGGDQDRVRFDLARSGYFIHKLEYTCTLRGRDITDYHITIDVAVL